MKPPPEPGKAARETPSGGLLVGVDELGDLLEASGSPRGMTQVIKEHLSSGAPSESDGRIDLLALLAWLLNEHKPSQPDTAS